MSLKKMTFVLVFSQQQRRFHLQTKAVSCHTLTEEETKTFCFDVYKHISDASQIWSLVGPTGKEETADTA